MSAKAKTLPHLPAKAPKKPETNRYREQYGVILICPDEAAQKRIFEALEAIMTCRVRVVTT